MNPKMASEWHPTKNECLSANEVTINHAKKVWWKCEKSQCEHEHEWFTSVNSRTSQASGCPYCVGNQAAFCPCDSIATTNPGLAAQLHPDEAIPATELVAYSEKKVLWKCPNSECKHEHVWTSTVHNRSAGNGCPFCSNPPKQVCECNSFGTLNPVKAKQWSEKNGDLSPFDFTPHSNEKFWWKCANGPDHEWKGPISDRTRKDQHGGCPFCSTPVKRVSITNCLATMNPDAAQLWHPSKNLDLTPRDVLSGSSKKVWWKCPDGPDHEWRAPIERVSGNISKYDLPFLYEQREPTGCPFCSGHQVSETNRLDILYPKLAEEWHPVKNGTKKPGDFTRASNKKVWWKCSKCDREWNAVIGNRTGKKPKGCSACAKHGFDPTAPAYYYAMEISGPSDIWWYKGGIAADPKHRRYIIERSLKENAMHVDVKIIQVIEFDVGADAKVFEKQLLDIKKIRVKTLEKFDGSTELFSTNPIQYAEENGLFEGEKSTQMKLEDFY